MNNDTIQMAADSLMQTSQQDNSLNWWMVIAIIELIIIIALLFSKNKADSKKRSIKKQVMEEGKIDYSNIIASSFGAEALYKELIKKCHPDRFAPDKERVAIANDISTRIGKNQHDLKKLNELKEEAVNKLNIKL